MRPNGLPVCALLLRDGRGRSVFTKPGADTHTHRWEELGKGDRSYNNNKVQTGQRQTWPPPPPNSPAVNLLTTQRMFPNVHHDWSVLAHSLHRFHNLMITNATHPQHIQTHTDTHTCCTFPREFQARRAIPGQWHPPSHTTPNSQKPGWKPGIELVTAQTSDTICALTSGDVSDTLIFLNNLSGGRSVVFQCVPGSQLIW